MQKTFCKTELQFCCSTFSLMVLAPFLFLQLFHHLALPVAMQRNQLVDAIFSVVSSVHVIVSNDEGFVQCLHKESSQEK